jgi:O-antigen ligase
LFGIGYKTLPYSDFVGRTVIADNTYLSLLVETGILGLSALMLLNYSILHAGLRSARSSVPSVAFFGTWIFCFWTGQLVQMASGDLITYWRVLPVYFWVLAMAMRTRNENSVSRSVQ